MKDYRLFVPSIEEGISTQFGGFPAGSKGGVAGFPAGVKGVAAAGFPAWSKGVTAAGFKG